MLLLCLIIWNIYEWLKLCFYLCYGYEYVVETLSMQIYHYVSTSYCDASMSCIKHLSCMHIGICFLLGFSRISPSPTNILDRSSGSRKEQVTRGGENPLWTFVFGSWLLLYAGIIVYVRMIVGVYIWILYLYIGWVLSMHVWSWDLCNPRLRNCKGRMCPMNSM